MFFKVFFQFSCTFDYNYNCQNSTDEHVLLHSQTVLSLYHKLFFSSSFFLADQHYQAIISTTFFEGCSRVWFKTREKNAKRKGESLGLSRVKVRMKSILRKNVALLACANQSAQCEWKWMRAKFRRSASSTLIILIADACHIFITESIEHVSFLRSLSLSFFLSLFLSSFMFTTDP